jgi:hypothetical protein
MFPEPYSKDAFLSDHIPVAAKTSYKNQKSQFPCIPHFITQQPIFRCEVNRLVDKHNFANCCWAWVAEMKEIFFSAYEHYKKDMKSRGALFAKERIFWSLEAIRASDMLDIRSFLKASEASPQLQHSSFSGQLPISSDHLASIRVVLRDALQLDDADKQAELEHVAGIPEYETTRRKDCIMKRLSRHNPKRRKLGIEAVRGPNGEIIFDTAAAEDHLSKHWGEKFKNKPISKKEAEQVTSNFSKRFPTIQWMITLAAFVDVVASCKPSAPGPDGVPYGAWGSDIRAQVVLYSAYVTWLLHGYVPLFFNAPYLWLLPKCSPDDGIFRKGNDTECH